MPAPRQRILAEMDRAIGPLLKKGERREVGLQAIVGPSPWLASGVLAAVGQFLLTYTFVQVTDRRVLFVRLARWGMRPQGLAFADPRAEVSIVGWKPGPVWSVLRYRRPDASVLRLNVHLAWREDAERLVKALGSGRRPRR